MCIRMKGNARPPSAIWIAIAPPDTATASHTYVFVRWSQAYGRKCPPAIEAIASGTPPGAQSNTAITMGKATICDIASWIDSAFSGFSFAMGPQPILRSRRKAAGSARPPWNITASAACSRGM